MLFILEFSIDQAICFHFLLQFLVSSQLFLGQQVNIILRGHFSDIAIDGLKGSHIHITVERPYHIIHSFPECLLKFLEVLVVMGLSEGRNEEDIGFFINILLLFMMYLLGYLGPELAEEGIDICGDAFDGHEVDE